MTARHYFSYILCKEKLIMTVCKFNAIIYQGIDIGGVING